MKQVTILHVERVMLALQLVQLLLIEPIQDLARSPQNQELLVADEHKLADRFGGEDRLLDSNGSSLKNLAVLVDVLQLNLERVLVIEHLSRA